MKKDEMKAIVKEAVQEAIQEYYQRNEIDLADTDKLLSNKEAREILGVTYPTMKLMLEKGQLKPIKVGQVNKYRYSDIIQIRGGR